MSRKNRVRIYIDTPLSCGETVGCAMQQTHYLLNVMRLRQNDEVFIFNGRDGEFRAEIGLVGKKSCELVVKEKIADFKSAPDVWLLFAPLKRDNTDLAVSKAVELGVAKIIPVITEYTITSQIRCDRLESLAIEAAEQSRRQDVPEILSPMKLSELLAQWPVERRLIYLDETGSSSKFTDVCEQILPPAALLVGPEGGFSEKELEMLRSLPYTQGVSLGERILRAETAVVAGLSCWQMLCGDWR